VVTDPTWHDVAVIGGGVAGLAAVRALQRAGQAPLLIAPAEARFANRGELLGAAALGSLTALGGRDLLDDRRIAMPADAQFSAWGAPALVRQPLGPNGSGWHIDRQRLEDAMLARVVASPMLFIDASVRGCERYPDGWHLSLSTGMDLRVRFLIDATGRAAAVARRLGGTRRHLGRLVALMREFSTEDGSVMAASLVEATPQGWWYTSRMPRRPRLFAAFFTDADLLPSTTDRRESWSCRLAEAPYTRARLESLGIDASHEPPAMVRAGTTVQECVAGDGWAAVGDAAVSLDPLAGHGLAIAFWSAVQAADAALAWMQGDAAPLGAYEGAVASGVTRFVADAAVHYRAEGRFWDCPFWGRRQQPAAVPARRQPQLA
jgi:flavin-dependent dehydrogenase